jgi:hypothetical protein
MMIGGWDDTPPPRIEPWSSASGYNTGSAACMYAKPVDCEADFNGDPITLEFNQHSFECLPNYRYRMASVPSTVELALDWEL